MQTLSLVQDIIKYADAHGPIAAYKTLSIVERILENTSSYMHEDILRAALKEDGKDD